MHSKQFAGQRESASDCRANCILGLAQPSRCDEITHPFRGTLPDVARRGVAFLGGALVLGAGCSLTTDFAGLSGEVPACAGDGVRLYLNGALVASAAPKSPAERGDWNGAVDELRIYDYALTAEQVTNDFKKP